MANLEDLEQRIEETDVQAKKDHTLLLFFLGVILLAVGVFMVFQTTNVTSNWPWYIGSFRVPTGTVVIPLLVGIGILFFNSKSVWGWIVTIMGTLFVLLTIIMSVQIRFSTSSLFSFVLMFGSITAGAGLIMRALFKPKKKK